VVVFLFTDIVSDTEIRQLHKSCCRQLEVLDEHVLRCSIMYPWLQYLVLFGVIWSINLNAILYHYRHILKLTFSKALGICRISMFDMGSRGISSVCNFTNYLVPFGMVAVLLDLDSKSWLNLNISKIFGTLKSPSYGLVDLKFQNWNVTLNHRAIQQTSGDYCCLTYINGFESPCCSADPSDYCWSVTILGDARWLFGGVSDAIQQIDFVNKLIHIHCDFLT